MRPSLKCIYGGGGIAGLGLILKFCHFLVASLNQNCVVAFVSSSGERNNSSQVVALYAHTVITLLMKN